MTDWNPSDPDAVRVVYDLARWTFDQQAELASDLAERGVPHTWDGTDLVVPEEAEGDADEVIAVVEERLGIVDDDGLDGVGRDGLDTSGIDVRATMEELDALEPIELPADAPTTEYDLSEWPPEDRMVLTQALTGGEVPFRWEGQHVLLVGTDDEELVDDLLDQVERGELADPDAAPASGDQLPFETLTTFFLAGERLRRDPLDADGLEQLLAAVEVADPQRPPYGVQPRLWLRVCDLAERLSGALGGPDDGEAVADDGETDRGAGRGTDLDADLDADLDTGGDEPDPFDHDAAVAIATQLHDVLRPYV